jgi:hypothetical protein
MTCYAVPTAKFDQKLTAPAPLSASGDIYIFKWRRVADRLIMAGKL